MSDKIVQTLSGRIFKEPVVGEKSIRVEIISNLYQKSDDPKNNTHALFTTILLTGGLMKLWSGRLAELSKGSRVHATGEWNFSLFSKKDGTPGFSGSLFPMIFEVSPPRTASAPAVDSAAAVGADAGGKKEKEDELPF